MKNTKKILLIIFGILVLLAGAGVGGYFGFVAYEKHLVAKSDEEDEKVRNAFYKLNIKKFVPNTTSDTILEDSTNIEIQGMTGAVPTTQNTKIRFGDSGQEYDLVSYAKSHDTTSEDNLEVQQYDFILIIDSEIREFKVTFNFEDYNFPTREQADATIQTNSVFSLEDLEKFEITNQPDEQLKLNGISVIDLYNKKANDYKILVGTSFHIAYDRETMEVSDFEDIQQEYIDQNSDDN